MKIGFPHRQQGGAFPSEPKRPRHFPPTTVFMGDPERRFCLSGSPFFFGPRAILNFPVLWFEPEEQELRNFQHFALHRGPKRQFAFSVPIFFLAPERFWRFSVLWWNQRSKVSQVFRTLISDLLWLNQRRQKMQIQGTRKGKFAFSGPFFFFGSRAILTFFCSLIESEKHEFPSFQNFGFWSPLMMLIFLSRIPRNTMVKYTVSDNDIDFFESDCS
jgi:hypothetical protein